MKKISLLYTAIVEGNAALAKSLAAEAVEAGTEPGEVLDRYLIPAMGEVGRKFEDNEYYIPDLLMAAHAMKSAMEILKPSIIDKGVKPAGKVAIGTVRGDLHDIGKNLVAVMLEGNGFEVLDLGVDTPVDKFIAAVGEKQVQVIALSALLTTTMLQMKIIVEELEKKELRDRVKVVIGGAPVTGKYADSIGADGYSDNASGAVTLVRRLMGTG
jgi:corrinoid protein of di/trimethylamine methyltransferase